MNTRKTIYAGLFVAIGLVLPMIFHQFSMGGPVFLPMHIPVLIGGFVLGPIYGLLIGLITPALSSVLTGMPPFPVVFTMIAELGLYGLISGYLYKNKGLNIFLTLLIAMVIGRLASGTVLYILSLYIGKIEFISFPTYLKANVLTGLPGIGIQLVFIPLIVKAIESNFKTNMEV